MEDFSELAQRLQPMLNRLSSQQRRQLTLAIARTMRRQNQQRVRNQKNPDGTTWQARKKSSVSKGNISFYYHDKFRQMKSWADRGDYIIGYDIESGGIRSFTLRKVEKWLPSYTSSKTRSGTSKEKMFRKLMSTRYLRAHTSEHHAAIQFTGRIARIAQVHQHGLRERVSPKGPLHVYPQRQLLGLTQREQQDLMHQIIEHLTK